MLYSPTYFRLVSHLGASPEKLTREEVVTLCLLIYFRGMWTEEEISARLGTIQILRVITKVIETSGTSNAEVVALCLGMSLIDIAFVAPTKLDLIRRTWQDRQPPPVRRRLEVCVLPPPSRDIGVQRRAHRHRCHGRSQHHVSAGETQPHSEG